MTQPNIEQFKQSDSNWNGFLDEIGKQLSAERLALWSLDRSYNQASAFVLRDETGAIKGALLEAGRQKTNYRKIVDFITDSNESLEILLKAEFTHSENLGCISVKCEEHKNLHSFNPDELQLLEKNGFEAEPEPVYSVDSTHGDVHGWTKWFTQKPSRRIAYFGQTTDVTCGAGTALMAIESSGGSTFIHDDYATNREIEIDVWRSATNMPACEPVALAITTHQRVNSLNANLSKPTVYLSTESTSLLEWFKDFDYTLREQLQLESFRKADALGIEVIREWISTEDIFENVKAGNLVYLLIDLTVMINDPTPHWVLAHEVIDSCLVISDPWVELKTGETWVDCSNLPVSFETVDEMTRWGEPSYRGVVIVPSK